MSTQTTDIGHQGHLQNHPTVMQDMKHPAFGVFEGGGIRGIGLAGAAAAVLDAGYRFERVAGTSAGALAASLIAADYTGDELRRQVAKIDWPALLDGVPGLRIPIVGRHVAFLRGGGLYRGAELQRVWGRLLAEKGISTFGDLEPGRLRVVAVDLTHERGVVLPDGLAEYGIDASRFPIARAVRMSSAVPFVFRPVELQNRYTGDISLMADGALGSKFPVELVDPPDGHRRQPSAQRYPGSRLAGGSCDDHRHVGSRDTPPRTIRISAPDPGAIAPGVPGLQRHTT